MVICTHLTVKDVYGLSTKLMTGMADYRTWWRLNSIQCYRLSPLWIDGMYLAHHSCVENTKVVFHKTKTPSIQSKNVRMVITSFKRLPTATNRI